jgi:hypothetical protein
MTEVQNRVTKLSLSQAKAEEIRQRLDQEVLPAIRSAENELAQIEHLSADWRSTSGNVAAVERVADDRKRLTNRLDILGDVRRRAEAELRIEQAQVEVDALHELRNEMQRLGDQRTQRARDIVATAEMLAAMVSEVESLRVQMISLAHTAQRFFVGRPGIAADSPEAMRRSESFSGLLRLLQSTEVQAAVEHVIGAGTPAHVWEYQYRASGGRAPDAVAKIGGQCQGSLFKLDSAMRMLIDDAKVVT